MRALAIAALVAGCSDQVGTIQLGLTNAPGSTLLDTVSLLRVTLTNPRQVIEAPRTERGFDLAFELEAADETGALIVEGLDDGGALVAAGQSPSFPVSAIDARIVVYMATPMSIGLAPNGLGTPRKDVSGARLSYGAILAGGADAADVPSSAIAVYNSFDHSLAGGMPMPGPRRGVTLATDSTPNVFVFGGSGPEGPTGTLWLFNTGIAPAGAYQILSDQPATSRTGETAVAVGPSHFLITGTPPLELQLGQLAARTDLAALPRSSASQTGSDGVVTALFAGAEGVIRYRADAFETVSADPRPGASVVALADNRFLVIGGETRDALVVDAITGVVTTLPNALAVVRQAASAAATARHVVISGGVAMDGTPHADAEVLDANTLAPLASLPARERTAGFAIAFPNDQIMIGGGTAASGDLELFTPPPP
ncbi:MAG: hypothetical protein WKG01_29090 [Kofleriaceae bacterium]